MQKREELGVKPENKSLQLRSNMWKRWNNRTGPGDPVAEPGTMLLLGAGLVCLAGFSEVGWIPARHPPGGKSWKVAKVGDALYFLTFFPRIKGGKRDEERGKEGRY